MTSRLAQLDETTEGLSALRYASRLTKRASRY